MDDYEKQEWDVKVTSKDGLIVVASSSMQD